MPALTALVVDVTRPEERGPALGFFTAFIEVGIVVGAMGLGFITEILAMPICLHCQVSSYW